MAVVKLLRVLVFLLPIAVSEAQFTYDNPIEWILQDSKCAGFMQSPIALHSGKSYRLNIDPLRFNNYDVPIAQPVAINDGHTVAIHITSTTEGTIPSISGGGLDSVYQVQGLHFHWGANPRKSGSEHTINGKLYDLEMHIVHKNVKYPTLNEAISSSDGFVVLGILFKAVENSYLNSSTLYEIYDALPSLTRSGSKQPLHRSITMRAFLNNLKPQQFFTYHGSLTTPPCSEAVTWFVFTNVIPIEFRYLQRFWKLHDFRGAFMLNTCRPLQPTRYRRVYLNKFY